VGALNDVRLLESDRLLDYLPTEGLPPGPLLWVRHPVEPWFIWKHLPEVWIVIESMQWKLQLVRQRLGQCRLTSAACSCNKNMLLSTALVWPKYSNLSCNRRLPFYSHLCFSLSATSLSPILSMTMDEKA
jgi:hypothetical protein